MEPPWIFLFMIIEKKSRLGLFLPEIDGKTSVWYNLRNSGKEEHCLQEHNRCVDPGMETEWKTV